MKKIILFLFLISCIIFPQEVGQTFSLPGGLSKKSEKEDASVKSTSLRYKLSLQDALTLAMERNRDILISYQDMRKSDAQVSEAYGNAFPQVNMTAGYTRNIEPPFTFFIPPNTPVFNPTDKTIKMSMGADNSYTANLSVNQVLFSAKVNTAIQIAKEYKNYSEYNAQSTSEEVVLSVKKAYYGVLLTQKVVDVSRESYELTKAHYENIKKLFDEGVAAEFDLLRAEVQVANTEPALSQAENNLVLTKNGLKNLLGLGLDEEIELTGNLEMDELPFEVITKEGELALERNSGILGLIYMERMLDKNIQIQKADYYPTLAAYGVYQYQTQDNTFRFKDYTWAKNFYVGLQISYPIFNGMQTQYRAEQALIDKEKLVLNRIKLEEGIKIQLEAAELKMQEAKKRVDAQSKSVEQAQKAVKIAEVRFENGVGTQLELFDSQVALTATQINRAQAAYDYLIARAEWEKASGYNQNNFKEKN